MLCRKFDLTPIKIGFFMNFKSCSKIGPKTMGYSTGSLSHNLSKIVRREFSICIIFSDTYTCTYVV